MNAWMRQLIASSLIGCLAAALAGCASVSDQAQRSSLEALRTSAPPQRASTKSSPARSSCGDEFASLRPPGLLPAPLQMATGTFMRRIQDRGRLVVGVDQATLLLGSRDPSSGEIEGFEIDMLRHVAKAIFGRPNRIRFKAITSAQREEVIRNGSVDIVANLMTITCKRRKQVAFTTVYYVAAQRVLVPETSAVRSIGDLARKKVCAADGTTSIDYLKEESLVVPHPVPLRTDCLVALQQGMVAAISTDDAILYGFRKQDPTTKIVGRPLSVERWGMAINKAHPEFVRFVNAVLARMRSNGTWTSIYKRWLGRVTRGRTPAPPQPRYSN